MNESGSVIAVGFDVIAKNLREQRKFNRGVIVIALLTTAHILTLYKKIERLNKEVQELKQTRGE